MDRLSPQLIGTILSRVGDAPDVLIASATCRKWQEARKNHVDTLSFNYQRWPGYKDIPTSRLETLITQTIFQASPLKRLTLFMDDTHKFSAASVIGWLMHTRATLQVLYYKVTTATNVNILEICGRDKLEELVIFSDVITGVVPWYHTFPCLKSLILADVSISLLDLELLVTACPRIEFLKLFELINPGPEGGGTMVLNSCSLKEVFIHTAAEKMIQLKTPRLEMLRLKNCVMLYFELIGEVGLRQLKIDNVHIGYLDIGENTENLEWIVIAGLRIAFPKFHHLISRSKNLERLDLSGIEFVNVDSVGEDDVFDLAKVSVCCPQLTSLALGHMSYGRLNFDLVGTFRLESVVELVLGWSTLSDLYPKWVEEMVGRCPNLKKLIISGHVSKAETLEEGKTLANMTTSIFLLMKRYLHITVEFDFE